MAVFASRHVWVVVILCVALLFVSGIILPKLLSKHYFELRSELSAHNKSIILDNYENIIPTDTKTGDQVNTIHSSKLYQDSFISKSMQYDGTSSIREISTLPRRVKRSLRQASNEDGNEYFSWNFNLNISRYKNPASSVFVGNIKPDAVDNSKKSDLGAAIYLEGKGPNQTYNMLKALASAGAFIRSLFGEGVQNLTYEETEKNNEDYSIKDILQTGSDIKEINHGVSVNSDICKGNETKCERRRGRFFNFLLRRTSVAKTTQSIGNNVTSESPHETTSTISSDKNETGFNIGKNIFALTGSRDVDFDESPVSKSEHSPTSSVSCSTRDGCESLGNLNGVTEINSSEFRNITAEKECTNCGLNFEENERAISDNFDTTAAFSDHPFTDEKLEDFCMNLVHQLGKTMPFLSVNESSEDDGKNKESNLSTPPKLKAFDCLNLLGASEEKPKTDFDVIEDSFLVSTDAADSNNESAKDTKRNARILSWLPFGFGSGRSSLDAPLSEELDEPNERNEDSKAETENEPTIKDCISYFRRNQNVMMFPKPNLMDIISDSNIEITDFANATISPKLKEQQMQFITNFLETIAINCAEEKDGTNSKFSNEEKEQDTENGEASTRTSVTDFKWIDTQVTSEGEHDEGIPQVTEKERDERIFGFGSGNDASPEMVNLRFINSKNGEEKLQETSSAAYSFDPVTSVNFVSNSDLEDTSNQGRFFMNLGFASGEGRQLKEDSDIYVESTEHIEIECENDCFVETTTIQTDDCNDNGCYSEQPFEQIFSRESLQKQSDDENDCHDDCSAFFPNDSNVTEIKGNISYDSEFKDGNLTSSNLKFFNESCSCHEHGTEMSFIPENADSFECDDCIDGLLDKNFNSENKSFQIGFGNDCDDCGYQPKTEMQNPESDTFEIASTYADSRSLNDAVSENIIESSEFQAVKDTDRTEAVETATELSNIREEFETKQNTSRFLIPLLLTGSGDGGLFGDSAGRINLTEQNSNDKPPRRARLDDEGEIDQCDDCGDMSDIQGNQGTLKETVKDNLASFTTENSNPDDEILKPSIGPYEGKSNQTIFATKAAKESYSSEVPSKSILDFSGDIFTTAEPQARFCISASECDSKLNERCVTKDLYSSICSCGRAFVRNRITGKCMMKSSYKADLKFPAESYVNDLGNPYSESYKQKQGDANKMMYALLKDNPGLAPIVADVTFAGFSSGSLIMSWNIIIAAENESETEMVSHLQKDLNRALLDEGLKEQVPFNISNAYVLSVSSTMDPCTSTELNYCYRHSQCVRNRSLPGGYECRCDGDHMDVSFRPEYPAETCEAFCIRDYCGHHGDCVWVPDGGRHCVCKDWYFGDRCGISGRVVVAGFSANVLVFMILMLVLFVCKTRRGRSRTYGRTPRHDSNQPGLYAISAGRVSDVIAMEENIGARVGKMSKISTPVQNVPVIKVVRPTLSESSISIYDDSTFDVTPTSESGQ